MLFAHCQKAKTLVFDFQPKKFWIKCKISTAKFRGVWLHDAFVDTTDFDACVDATEIITLLLLLKVELSGEVPNQCRRGTSASSALLQVTL